MFIQVIRPVHIGWRENLHNAISAEETGTNSTALVMHEKLKLWSSKANTRRQKSGLVKINDVFSKRTLFFFSILLLFFQETKEYI